MSKTMGWENGLISNLGILDYRQYLVNDVRGKAEHCAVLGQLKTKMYWPTLGNWISNLFPALFSQWSFIKCNDGQVFWWNIFLTPFQASLIMYELAWKMSKDSNDLLWWAAIGLTHQYLYEKIDRYFTFEIGFY